MNKGLFGLILAAAIAPISTSAYALPDNWNSVGHYPEVRNETAVKIYLLAAGNSYLAANVELRATGKDELYCQPDQLALMGENYVEIFEKQLASLKGGASEELSRTVEGTPIEFVLLQGLKATFPCPERR